MCWAGRAQDGWQGPFWDRQMINSVQQGWAGTSTGWVQDVFSNAGGGGAHQQWIGKAVLLFWGLGCNLLNCLPLSQCLLPWPWLRASSNPTEHQKVLNLVKGEGAGNNWGFPASFAHPVSSLHLCRHSSQLTLSSILPFHFPTLAKPPAQQGQPDSDITLSLLSPQGGSRGDAHPPAPKAALCCTG